MDNNTRAEPAATARPVVGFIGIGRMGAPMCRNLLRAGVDVVACNRTRAKAESLGAEGASIASGFREIADRCDVIFTCVDTHAASEEIYRGRDGLIALAKQGALLVEHSTINPDLAVRIAAAAATAGLEYIDAPVSGGPEGAANGTLAIMVGGTEAAYARALPLLRAYGSTIRRMGAAGSGTRAKLVNQLLTFAHGAAAAEAIALADRASLDLVALSDVLRAGFAQSRMFERTLARVQHASYDAGAMLVHFQKDLRAVSELGAQLGLTLTVTESSRALLDAVVADGQGGQDIAALRLRYLASNDDR